MREQAVRPTPLVHGVDAHRERSVGIIPVIYDLRLRPMRRYAVIIALGAEEIVPAAGAAVIRPRAQRIAAYIEVSLHYPLELLRRDKVHIAAGYRRKSGAGSGVIIGQRLRAVIHTVKFCVQAVEIQLAPIAGIPARREQIVLRIADGREIAPAERAAVGVIGLDAHHAVFVGVGVRAAAAAVYEPSVFGVAYTLKAVLSGGVYLRTGLVVPLHRHGHDARRAAPVYQHFFVHKPVRMDDEISGLRVVSGADGLAESGERLGILHIAVAVVINSGVARRAERRHHRRHRLVRQHDVLRLALVGGGICIRAAAHRRDGVVLYRLDAAVVKRSEGRRRLSRRRLLRDGRHCGARRGSRLRRRGVEQTEAVYHQRRDDQQHRKYYKYKQYVFLHCSPPWTVIQKFYHNGAFFQVNYMNTPGPPPFSRHFLIIAPHFIIYKKF